MSFLLLFIVIFINTIQSRPIFFEMTPYNEECAYESYDKQERIVFFYEIIADTRTDSKTIPVKVLVRDYSHNILYETYV